MKFDQEMLKMSEIRLNADVKEYAVLVSIEEPTDFLRIGLTALVEILAGEVRRR